MTDLCWYERPITFIDKVVVDEQYGEFKIGWYYSDETGVLHGPFPKKEFALVGLLIYVNQHDEDMINMIVNSAKTLKPEGE